MQSQPPISLLKIIPARSKTAQKKICHPRNQYRYYRQTRNPCVHFWPRLTSTPFRRTVYADMAYKALTVQELLDLMKKIQGEKTNTQFAAEIGISKQYLTDIYNGRKIPSDTVSGALGFTTRVTTQYVPSATAAKEEMPSAIPKSKATRSRKRDSR